MARFEFEWAPDALDEIEAATEPVVELAANRVAQIAQDNAREISTRLSEAITATEPDRDVEGVFADVGYDKSKPGFVLWWHEVGTSRYGASPHLRPAASRKVI
jgi:hypothetical protein